MRVGCGVHTYEWIEDWARIPDEAALSEGWAHHGFATTSQNTLIGFHPGEPSVLVFDQEGTLLRSWSVDLAEGHGLTLCHEGGQERLWMADIGSKKLRRHGYDNPPGNDQISGRVVKFSLEGQALLQLKKPPLSIYDGTRFSPTAVAVNDEVHGGNGDVWVADGYGAYLVHRFDREGHYLSTLSGEEGAGRFDCPHGIFIDRRKPMPELYVADRSNGRFQVYDLEGRFKRVFGSEFLTTPSAMVTYQDVMVVAELRARITLLDVEDRLLGYLGDNEAVSHQDGWPNTLDKRGQIIPSDRLEPGKFNSPHGLGVDHDGNLYVSEWLIGGRYIKLARCQA